MTRRGRLAVAVAVLVLGSVVFASPSGAQPNSITTVDDGDAGNHLSMVLDSSGLAVIVSYSQTQNQLRLARCHNAACTDRTNTVLDTIGQYPSVALDAAGNPVISYYSVAQTRLRVMRCVDPVCADSDRTVTMPDPQQFAGYYTSIRLVGGIPVVAYGTGSGGPLRVLRCDDPACEGEETITVVDAEAAVGFRTSMVVSSAGHPRISYHDGNDGGRHRLLLCHDEACDERTLRTIDNTPGRGLFSSIALDSSGHPVVSYHDSVNNRLMVIRCTAPLCTGPIFINAPQGVSGGVHTSIAVNHQGFPVISYMHQPSNTLRVMTCVVSSCAGANPIADPDPGAGGFFTSVAIDAAGNPVVAYHHPGGGGLLKLLRCSTANCLDEEPPVTTIALDPATPNGSGGWYVTPVGVTVTGTDTNSGVAQTRCVLDPPAAPTSYDQLPAGQCTLTDVSADGTHTIYAASIDNSGNRSPVVSTPVFRIDRTAPDTALTLAPAQPDGVPPWYVTPVTALFGADDNPDGSGVAELRCALNPAVVPSSYHDLPAGQCLSLSVAVDGINRVYAASADIAGNVSELRSSLVLVDRVPPTAAIGLTPSSPDGENGWYVSPVELGISGSDATSGLAQVRCVLDPAFPPGSVDNLPPPPCFAGPVDSDGRHTVYAGTIDVAGHPSTLVSATFHIDRTFPVTVPIFEPAAPDGDNGWYVSDVAVAASVTDPLAFTRCALDPDPPPAVFDDLPPERCETLVADSDGDHAVYAASRDQAGNTESPVSATFRIDKTAPASAITLDPAEPDGENGWYVSPVTVAVAGVDTDIVETRCVLNPPQPPTTFDQLPESPCEGAVVEAEGSHVVYAASKDEAGNTEAPVSAPFRIRTSAPLTEIVVEPPQPDGADGWYVSDVAISVSGPADAEVRCVLNPETEPRRFGDLPESCALAAGPVGLGRLAQVALEDGTNVIYAASRDPSGLTEPLVVLTVLVDRAAPELTVTVDPDEIVVGGTAEVTIDATDATSGIASATCTPVNTDTTGARTITCAAVDHAGNATEIEVAYTVVAVGDDDDGGGGGDGGDGGDDLPRSGIDAFRLTLLAGCYLAAGLVLVRLSRDRRLRLRWPPWPR